MTTPTIDHGAEDLEQLTWHWNEQLRPRLDGLTDEEYLWEPVDGCWSIRPSADGHAIDWSPAPPDPPPVTTIAWRMAHLSVMVFGMRSFTHVDGGSPREFGQRLATMTDWPGTAADGLARLDAEYERWRAYVAGLGADGLAAPCGPAEGPWARHPMATLVLHLNREAIHHGAEIALLRDLYRASGGGRLS